MPTAATGALASLAELRGTDPAMRSAVGKNNKRSWSLRMMRMMRMMKKLKWRWSVRMMRMMRMMRG